MIQRAQGIVVSGEREGSATAVQLPDVPCMTFTIKALPGNTGTVYIGGPGVTVAGGTADATSGIPLAAGNEYTPPVYVNNLNEFYYICSDVNQDLAYIAIR